MARLTISLLAILLTACAQASASRQLQTAEVRSTHSGRAGNTELVAELRSAPPAAAPATARTTITARPSAWADVSLSVTAERLEYRLALQNPGGNRYGSAQLFAGSDEATGEVIATLFADAGLTARRADVRGTAIYASYVDREEVVQRLLSLPDSFFVVLHPIGEGFPLRGRVRQD